MHQLIFIRKYFYDLNLGYNRCLNFLKYINYFQSTLYKFLHGITYGSHQSLFSSLPDYYILHPIYSTAGSCSFSG